MFNNKDLVPAEWKSFATGPIWCFNPGIIRLNKTWVFVYRIIFQDLKRRLAICKLDDDFNIVQDTIVNLSDHIHFSSECQVHQWFADPRIFTLGDDLFVYFNSGWHDPINHQFIIQIDTQTLKPIAHARELLIEGERQTIEKNWMLFGNDLIYAIYSPSPHRVFNVQFDLNQTILNNNISETFYSGSAYLAQGSLRGGAPPQYHDGHYYSFCHMLHPEPNGARYEACAYRFSATFPFKPTHIPKHALKLYNPNGLNRSLPQLNPAVSEVIYPCGAAFFERKWVISYGINDEACAIATLTQESVNDSMECYYA